MRRSGSWGSTRCWLLLYPTRSVWGAHPFPFPPQGSFLVYPIDEEDAEDTTCQITKGIPKNSAIKVLVRAYIVKVTSSRWPNRKEL